MEETIINVQNYFIEKIVAEDFKSVSEEKDTGWTKHNIIVDEKYTFNLSYLSDKELVCFHGGFILIDQNDVRLVSALKKLSADFIISNKDLKIEKLKSELEKLQS